MESGFVASRRVKFALLTKSMHPPSASQNRINSCLNSMDVLSSPSLPFTSDPALCNDWKESLDPIILPSSTFSDEYEAIHHVQQETTARKNKEGTVIQHRAWPLDAVFRSEADYPEGRILRNPINTTSANPSLCRNPSQIAVYSNYFSILPSISQNAVRIIPNCIPSKLFASPGKATTSRESVRPTKTQGNKRILVR